MVDLSGVVVGACASGAGVGTIAAVGVGLLQLLKELMSWLCRGVPSLVEMCMLVLGPQHVNGVDGRWLGGARWHR